MRLVSMGACFKQAACGMHLSQSGWMLELAFEFYLTAHDCVDWQ